MTAPFAQIINFIGIHAKIIHTSQADSTAAISTILPDVL